MFPEKFQVYFDEEFTKTYVMPCEDSCDLNYMLRKFPTPDNFDEEGEQEDIVIKEGDDSGNIMRLVDDETSAQRGLLKKMSWV